MAAEEGSPVVGNPGEVDSPAGEEVRSSAEGVVHSFEVVVVHNPAGVDSPRALVLERRTFFRA